MEYCYALCFMLINFAISYQGTRANEMLTNVMFKVLSNEKRIDDLEMEFKTSMEGLNTRLSEELNKITETLKQYEPSMGEIRKDIKDTISNTVTQMVKSQHIALNIAMKREKVAMLKTQSEINEHMNLINSAFNNTQKNLQDEFQAQKESVEYFMTKVFNESEEHVKQLTENYEHAQGKFEDFFANKTETLDSKFNIQTEIVDHLIKTVLNESKQLQQMVDVYTEETKNTTQGIEDGLKEALEQMRNKLLENLNDETSALKTRITSQENSHSSLSSRLTSQLNGLQSDLRSYKSAADSVGSRVTSIEGRMTSRHVGFSATLSKKLPNISKNTRIVFGTELYDSWAKYYVKWSYYDYSTGIFLAPISGMYLFLFTVESFPSKVAEVCLSVEGSCKAYAAVHAGYGTVTGSNFCVIYVSAGFRVWVQTASSRSSYDVNAYRTTFSGALIHI